MSDAKRLAGEKAIEYVEDGMVVGVGTGSTVAFFIDALAGLRDRITGAVSSSEQSTERLRGHGIEVLDLNACGPIPLYVDGADECDPGKRLIKGGGAALTREKIIAEAAAKLNPAAVAAGFWGKDPGDDLLSHAGCTLPSARCYMVKPHGSLVLVSSMHYCTYTPSLSTTWS